MGSLYSIWPLKEGGNRAASFYQSVYSTYPGIRCCLMLTLGNSYVPEIPYSQNSFGSVHHACIRSGEGGTLPFMLGPATEWSEYTTSEVKEIQWTERVIPSG